jgi:hypothetical protein
VGTNPGAKHIDNPVYDNKNTGRLAYSGILAKNPLVETISTPPSGGRVGSTKM